MSHAGVFSLRESSSISIPPQPLMSSQNGLLQMPPSATQAIGPPSATQVPGGATSTLIAGGQLGGYSGLSHSQASQLPSYSTGPSLTSSLRLPSSLSLPAVQPLLPSATNGITPILPGPAGTQAYASAERMSMLPQPAPVHSSMVSPQEIEARKDHQHQAIDNHLTSAQRTLEEQTRNEKVWLRSQADQAKTISRTRWDQHLRAQGARQMKLQLEKQALDLTHEYHIRQGQEDINRHRHEIDLHHWETKQKVGFMDKYMTPQEIKEEQTKKERHFRLRQSQAARRSVDALPEFSLARWEGGPAPISSAGTAGPQASPYPMALPAPDPYAPLASSAAY
eukprot:TRINITY_DN11783_c0_g2_i2.p1 TRINITY_DN11783_c0_g2~~TRINITY_DN11783_c0_g2_i2.p1  ORF type:complete len:348 (+),score=36.81 TRINITY_DN11783_c0_g2_i2:35-1045(+)